MEYDAANRLICYNDKEITYDADGNMLQGVVAGEVKTLKYDCRNRLTKAGGTTYKYNAENTRISTETAEKTTEYVTDVSGSLSRVLAEYVTDKEGGQTTYTIYVYGQGLVSQEDIIGDKISYNYYTYHYNHLGSTTAITDEEGNVAERFTYGTYGELLSGTTDKVHYLYNGQYGVSTEDNGLYYMRQRYYNPEIKRFINQDIVTGSIGNSQSLNRYCYVQGNPVSMTDPFGLFPIVFNGRELLHAFLNLAGMYWGGLGTVADIANAALYALEGDASGTISCLISSLPYIGDVAGARLIAKGGKWVKTGKIVRWSTNLIGNGVTFLRSGGEFISGLSGLIQDYKETGEIKKEDVGAVILNGATALISGKNTIKSGNALRKLVSESNVANKFRKTFGRTIFKEKPITLNYKTTSGAELISTPGKTTTVLGTYKDDTQNILNELGNVKSLDFGSKTNDFNLLNTPDELFVDGKQFWKEYNKPWLDNAIERDDIIVLATEPTFKNLTRLNRNTNKLELSGFGREYLHLRKNGYKYDAVTKTMKRTGGTN